MKITPFLFPNYGYLETKLPSEALEFLKEAIKNKQEKINSTLAGNIGSSHTILDKDDWFFNHVLQTCISHYTHHFGKDCIQTSLTRDCRYALKSMWVNCQKKHQFNPLHNHSGFFSFVVWYKIPFSGESEKNLPFSKHSNIPSASCFEFAYNDVLGRIRNKIFSLSPQDEGTMLFFPATLMHQVYPFYTSDNNRISISGNISLDPEQMLNA